MMTTAFLPLHRLRSLIEGAQAIRAAIRASRDFSALAATAAHAGGRADYRLLLPR